MDIHGLTWLFCCYNGSLTVGNIVFQVSHTKHSLCALLIWRRRLSSWQHGVVPLSRVEVTDHLDTGVSQQCVYNYNVRMRLCLSQRQRKAMFPERSRIPCCPKYSETLLISSEPKSSWTGGDRVCLFRIITEISWGKLWIVATGWYEFCLCLLHKHGTLHVYRPWMRVETDLWLSLLSHNRGNLTVIWQ